MAIIYDENGKYVLKDGKNQKQLKFITINLLIYTKVYLQDRKHASCKNPFKTIQNYLISQGNIYKMQE